MAFLTTIETLRQLHITAFSNSASLFALRAVGKDTIGYGAPTVLAASYLTFSRSRKGAV